MPRPKLQTLTEQMFYVLLCLRDECYGIDIFDKVSALTQGRGTVGSRTMYNLLEQFLDAGMIREVTMEGRRRSGGLYEYRGKAARVVWHGSWSGRPRGRPTDIFCAMRRVSWTSCSAGHRPRNKWQCWAKSWAIYNDSCIKKSLRHVLRQRDSAL